MKCGNVKSKEYNNNNRLILCDRLAQASLQLLLFYSVNNDELLALNASDCSGENMCSTSPNSNDKVNSCSPLSSFDWYKIHIQDYYKSNLKIGHLNINSIFNKLDEVKAIFNTYLFDILVLAETNVSNSF